MTELVLGLVEVGIKKKSQETALLMKIETALSDFLHLTNEMCHEVCIYCLAHILLSEVRNR